MKKEFSLAIFSNYFFIKCWCFDFEQSLINTLKMFEVLFLPGFFQDYTFVLELLRSFFVCSIVFDFFPIRLTIIYLGALHFFLFFSIKWGNKLMESWKILWAETEDSFITISEVKVSNPLVPFRQFVLSHFSCF